ncbi:hypothetical protein NE237_006343 [Protea cynaroides]|uniref:F-box domain-containing protein n=1 Tax=Protea cynaroides TaxID=273540 RepID=A0A9Q0QVF3_9MAGN|nr:hypothetical protein NE237_006343 [Protea cynaroides]
MAAAAQPQTKKWSELPEELILMIGERINLYADYVRFCSVCVSWYSAIAKNLCPSRQHQYFPFLLLPCEDDEEDNSDTCNHHLLSLPENSNIYHFRGLPKQSTSLYCPGSSHGWLVMVEVSNFSIYLVNPFTKVELPLPSLYKFRRVLKNQPPMFGVKKVVLSSSPSSSSLLMSSQFQSSNVVAVAIFNGLEALTFSRPGDKTWGRITFVGQYFSDVLFYRDHLYTISGTVNGSSLQIFVFKLNVDIGGGGDGRGHGLVPKIVRTLQLPKSYNIGWRSYLVESCGDLLLVARDIGGNSVPNTNPHEGKTIGFKVFKLCGGNDNRSSTWVEMKNLGDRMLFLGVNSSLSLSSHDFPGCRGNSIYFTHWECRTNHFNVKQYDMGIFNLEDKRIEPLPLQGCTSSTGRHLLQKLCAPPIWLFPYPN